MSPYIIYNYLWLFSIVFVIFGNPKQLEYMVISCFLIGAIGINGY
jgi:hypothetical protein